MVEGGEERMGLNLTDHQLDTDFYLQKMLYKKLMIMNEKQVWKKWKERNSNMSLKEANLWEKRARKERNKTTTTQITK